MVGIVIFKDFESGSYERMRVTLYRGHTYADIDRQDDFSSCLVSLERQSVVYDASYGNNAPRLGMYDVLELCKKAREYLYEHDWITMAEFCADGENVSFRVSSVKSGLYAPVDVRTLFDYKVHRVYKLCLEEESQSFLCLSTRCAIVNYCLRHILSMEEQVFGVSGKGIYADISVFDFFARYKVLKDAPKEIRKFIKPMRIGRRRINTDIPPAVQSQKHADYQPHMSLIAYWQELKGCMLCKMCTRYQGTSMCAFEIALDMIENEEIKKSSEEFTYELLDYLGDYEFCFKAKSHINYICTEDALYLATDTDAVDKIAQKAAALSANMKLRKKIPCADYYDSHGRAYNM